MMKRFLLIAATFAATSFFGTAAQAMFTVSTAVTGVSGGGGTAVITATGGAYMINGATLTFRNSMVMGADNSRATANEGIVLTGAYTGATATLTITLGITINNASTPSFTQTATYTIDSSGLLFQGSVVTPPSVTIAGSTYSITGPKGTDLSFGDATAQASISSNITQNAVPEPASLALVGLGLAGVGGLALRRRTR